MNTAGMTTEVAYAAARDDLVRLRDALCGAITGQQALIEELLLAVFAQGHVLIEGMPGLGKTHLAKAIARSLGLELARIQCTPDLMPADIIGSEIIHGGDNGSRELRFRPGPLFAPMVLVDEINRATPKTQSAFLEAMQEGHVTIGSTRHAMPSPFWVLATQNPIELEGTYPLPEAQLDRFLFKLRIGYPDEAAMLRLIELSLDDEPANHLPALMDLERVCEIVELARTVIVAGALREAAVRMVLATHPDRAGAGPLRYGASPRGLQALLRGARVHALFDGRAHVAVSDLHAVALPALRHRVMLTVASELEGVDVDAVITGIVGRSLGT